MSVVASSVLVMVEGRISLKVGDVQRGPWALPDWEPVSVGRRAGSGLAIGEEWVPRGLCRFLPHPLGWLLQVGPRARVRVASPFVGDHVFDRHALVALQEGTALLTFPELDDLLQIAVIIGEGVAEGLEVLRDAPEPGSDEVGTAYASGRVTMTEGQRRTMATVFAYLIKGEPKPDNVAAHAARRLGRKEQSVKNVITDVRDKVNEERWLNLRTTDQLGHYLVHLSRNLMPSDLPAELQ